MSLISPTKLINRYAAAIILIASPLMDRAAAQAIDYAASATVDSGFALQNGSAVPNGSWMAFGYYPTALSGPLTEVSSMTDILNPGGLNAFVTLFEGTMGLEDGEGGFFEGLFAAGIQSFDATSVGKQLYYIVGNSSISLLDATEAGVFTSPTWIIPSLGDPVPSLLATDISEVPRNSTGILFGSQGIGIPVTEGLVDDPAGNFNLASLGSTPPTPAPVITIGPGTYRLPPEVKVKLGIDPIPGARYQWFKGRVAVKAATGPVLDLTPGILTFAPPQAGFYQLRVTEVGKPAELLGPWIITCDDPTVLVYNLNARGTETDELEPTESPLVLGGFLLLQPQSQEVTLIMTRTIGKGKTATRTFWVEQRPDASINSNGPVPGTPRMKASRTVVAGLSGTGFAELMGDALYGLTGDRDVLWLSGLDALVRLYRPNVQAAVVAPSRMTGFMGTLIGGTGGTQIGNFSLTASINVPETFKALDKNIDQTKDAIVTTLRERGFTPAGQ